MATEINAIVQFLDKAGTFIALLPSRWYKSSSDLDLFPTRVSLLRAKFETYTALLRRARLRDEKLLIHLAKEGTRILDEEEKLFLKEKKQKGFSRWKRRLYHRAFPGQLGVILTTLEEILNAGPQLLQFNLDTTNLVERNMASRLPFGHDRKYVPIVRSVAKVRTTLESEHECRVVTLHGMPGLGKTSLAKYVALQYQRHHTPEESLTGEGSSSVVFPDGVFFLRCGKGGERKVKTLQQHLLESLGCGSEAVPADIPEEYDGDYVTIPTFRRRLQFKLRNLKALIILDDVWERRVVEELVLSLEEAEDVKYLLTSQFIDIWPDAVKTRMERPSLQEARQILLKYTDALSTETEIPENIKDIADSIIQHLDFHPLTLANVGLGFRQQEGREPEEWRAVRDTWKSELQMEESYNPIIYGIGYPLALDKTMTRIVDSLKEGAKDLLLLMCVMNNGRVPEIVVKHFYKCAQSGSMSGYRYSINHLQNGSLVDVYRYRWSGYGGTELTIHNLRAVSITSQFQDGLLDLIERALQPMTEMYEHHDAKTTLIGIGDCKPRDVNNGIFTAIMAGMYMKNIYWDVARRISDAAAVEISKSVDFGVTLDDLLKTAGQKEWPLSEMLVFIHPNPNGEGWEQEAAVCAKKIIVKYTCRHELDDESVARLIQLPETFCGVCDFLGIIFDHGYWFTAFVEQNRFFSSAHPQTASSLFALVHNNATPIKTLMKLGTILCGKLFLMYGRCGILGYENDDIIINIGERLIKLMLGEHVDISYEDWLEIMRAYFHGTTRVTLTIRKRIPGLWKALLTLSVRKEWHLVRSENLVEHLVVSRWSQFISSLPEERSAASEMMDIAGVFELLCAKIGSCRGNVALRYSSDALRILQQLSSWEENRDTLSANPEIVTTVVGVLVRAVDEDWEAAKKSRWGTWERNSKKEWEKLKEADKVFEWGDARSVHLAVEVLRNLALSEEIRHKILSLHPEVDGALERLEQNMLPYQLQDFAVVSESRTIFSSSADHMEISGYHPPISEGQFSGIIEGRRRGYFAMKMYEQFLLGITGTRDPGPSSILRKEIIVANTRLERYASALTVADEEVAGSWRPHTHQFSKVTKFLVLLEDSCSVGQRGTVRLLSGGENLWEAVADFDKSLLLLRSYLSISGPPYIVLSFAPNIVELIYHMLKQRGFAKHLMGDDAGAKEDAIEAQQFHLRNLVCDRHYKRLWIRTMDYSNETDCWLFRGPLTYLGFNFAF